MRFHDIISIINKSKKIGVTYHVSPDGNALGSVLVLLQGIKICGKEAYVTSKNLVSDSLSLLPYAEEITGEVIKPSEDTSYVIVLDCGNVERISADLGEFEGTLVNMDHHLSNDKYGAINYVDTGASTTAEIMSMMLKELKVEINENVVKCLYTSLITGTGSFGYSNSTERTHIVTGELVNYVKHGRIHRNIFDNKPFAKMKLMSLVLEDMELVCNDKVVLMRVTKEMIDSIGEEIQNSSSVVSLGNQIKDIEGCILLKEVDKGVKVNLRSKDTLDVKRIAENFGSGGHTKASRAFTKSMSTDEAKNKILEILTKGMVQHMSGIANIYRNTGMISFDVMAMVRRVAKMKKVGRTGTLDPTASGVLPVCLGKAAKVIDYIMENKKVYRVNLKLGMVTDTYDLGGEVLREEDASHVTKDKILSCINSFAGTIDQVPPMYSTLKQNGVGLHELARQGIEVHREAEKITIYSIENIKIEPNDNIQTDVCYSKGAYIRSLCYDIGEKLSVGATTTALKRIQNGPLTREQAVSIKDLAEELLERRIISTERALDSSERIAVSEKFGKLLRNGAKVFDNRMYGEEVEFNKLYRAYEDNGVFLGLGKRNGKGFKLEKLLIEE